VAEGDPIAFRSGALTLEGLLTVPEAAAGATVLCHPHPLYGGNMHNDVVVALEQGYLRAGFATLRFNFRGVGRSDGGYEGGVGEVGDVAAAAAEIAKRTGLGNLHLGGYSFGAMMVARAAAELAPQRVVLVAPPLAFGGLEALARCTCPKLFIGGDRDSYCPAVELGSAVAALPEPKRVVVVPGADHFFAGYESNIAAAVL